MSGLAIRDVWMEAAARLEEAGIEDARFEAEVLLRHYSDRSRAKFYAHLEDVLEPDALASFQEAVERRLQREPSAYITGHREFYKLDIQVTPDVLIPRPETELLVEAALQHLRDQRVRRARVVDVGTGSGAIGLAILRGRRDARLLGIDVSAAALAVAQGNARRLTPRRRYDCLQGDLLTAITGPVDCVVANLPYVPAERVPQLEPEIHRFEPRVAVTPGTVGSELILRLVTQLGTRLAPGGIAVLEIDPEQAEEVALAARRLVGLAEVEVLEDLSGAARAVKIVAG